MTYYDKELEKLEKQQRELRQHQESADRDRYNTEEKPLDLHEYRKILNANINLAPLSNETLSDYIKKIKIYQEIAKKKNWDTHVDNPYKIWRTHKIPVGCFMCEDMIFIRTLISVLELLNEIHPNIKF